MKTLTCLIIAILVSISSLFSGDGMFVSLVIHGTDQPLRIDLPSSQYVIVKNFTQSPIIDLNDIGGIALYQGAAGLSGINVVFADASPHEDVYIAGPMIIYVQPIPGATLFLSYFLGSN